MKNREKFAKEIIDIACKGGTITITKDNKVVNCDDITCGHCLFNKTDDSICYRDVNALYRWVESEYVEEEKPTITLREKHFLNILSPKSKYIARDESNKLYVYNGKPARTNCYWHSNNGVFCYHVSTNIFGNMFDFIKWEDEEPWRIEDLKKLECEEYETD